MTKKLFALMTIAALMFTMTIVCFAAAGPAQGTLNVTGDELKGKNVSVYQIFSVNWDDKNGDGKMDANDNISYELTSDWEGFFTDARLTGITGASKSEKAEKYIASPTGDPDETPGALLQIAKEMKAYAKANNIAPTETQSNANSNTVSFTLDSGYYLVVPQSGSTSVTRQTDATLVNVPSNASANWNIKSEYPTVEKKANGLKENSANIGDTITFTLESEIPDLTEYADTPYYTLRFKDTFSNGLTFDGVATVTVTITDKDDPEAVTTLTTSTDFLPTYDSTTKTLTVALGREKTIHDDVNNADNTYCDLKTLLEAYRAVGADDKITITYTAKLNSNAIIFDSTQTVNYNDNTATVEYSNDPSDASSYGTSTPSITKTYTYPLTVYKHDASATPVALAGAVFQLLKNDQVTQINLVSVSSGSDSAPAVYRVATTDDSATVSSITTPGSGKVTIKGLAEGTYYLKETTAPTGYNKLDSDIVIVIAPSQTNGETDYSTPVYTVGGETDDSEIEVVNHKGTLLPTTGSIGTIGLTVLGVGVVIFGFVFTSRKKKKAE